MAAAENRPVVGPEDLSEAIRVLSTRLKAFDESSKETLVICRVFDKRLTDLESEVLPMKAFSQELSVARRNLGATIERMDEVNEYFGIESEAAQVVRRGLGLQDDNAGVAGTGLDNFIDTMKRLVNAEEYFRSWPSLKSQIDALKGLEAVRGEAIALCLQEFTRLVSSLGPAVRFCASSSSYEHIDVVSRVEMNTLGHLMEALDLLLTGQRGPSLSAYRDARKDAVTASLRSFGERFEANPAGRDARGSAAWLILYLGFGEKLMASEMRVCQKVIGPVDEAKSTLWDIVSDVVEKLVRDVDARTQFLLAELRTNADSKTAGGSGDIERCWEVLASLLEMAELLEAGVKDMRSTLEYGSDEEAGSGSSACPLVAKLADLQKRLSQAATHCCMDVVSAVRDDPVNNKRTLPDNASVHVLTSITLRAIKRIIPRRKGYEELVRKQTLPWDGIHPSASLASSERRGSQQETEVALSCPCFARFVNHVMNVLLENIVEKSHLYAGGLSNGARRHLFVLNNASYIQSSVHVSFVDLAGVSSMASESSVTGNSARAAAIQMVSSPSSAKGTSASGHASPPRGSTLHSRLSTLGGLLSPGSSSPPRSGAVSSFFNNSALQQQLSSDFSAASLSISLFLTRDTQQELQRHISDRTSAYCRDVLEPIAAIASDDIGALDYQRGKLLSLECGRRLKAKFSAFNEAWDELSASQIAVSVSDMEVRETLKQEARRLIHALYEALYVKYKDVQFSKKHQDQYLHHTPDDILRVINSLFKG